MDLKELRMQIDALDDEIAALYLKRLDVVRQVGEFKKQNGVNVEQKGREQEIFDRLEQKFGKENASDLNYLFTSVMTYSKMKQTLLNGKGQVPAFRLAETDFSATTDVALQGTEGAYSEQAAKKLFPNHRPKFFPSFRDVFESVKNGTAQYGVLPIENSTAGSVNEVYDLLRAYDVFVLKSLRLEIHHCLLAKKGVSKQDVKNVYSHPQALYQCKDYLRQHGFTPCEDKNTALACKRVSESSSGTDAAIGGIENAARYGLEILDREIPDEKQNYTRFIVIGREAIAPKNANKLSLMVTLPHVPDSLYRLLSFVSAFRVNLLKLESRPIPSEPFNFRFYLDLECNVFDESTKKLLQCIDAYSQTVTVLGAYTEDVE